MKVVYSPPDPSLVFNDMTPGKAYELIKVNTSPYLSNPKHESEVYVILNDKDEVKAYRATNFTPIDIIRENLLDDILK